MHSCNVSGTSAGESIFSCNFDTLPETTSRRGVKFAQMHRETKILPVSFYINILRLLWLYEIVSFKRVNLKFKSEGYRESLEHN